MERRKLWFGRRMKNTSDEALVRILLDPEMNMFDRHESAPWAFKRNGDVFEEYEYVAALARNRGFETSTPIERVDRGAR